jgi:hypothetical protein
MTALTGLAMLFADSLLDHKQQVVALWLLLSEFHSIPLADNPFLPIFVYLYELRTSAPNSCAPQLYDILTCVFGSFPLVKLGDVSVRTIFSPGYARPVPKAVNIALLKPYQARVSPVLAEGAENPAAVLTQPQAIAELLADDTIFGDFDPPFVRPVPIVAPLFQGELGESLVSSQGGSLFLWDEA